MQYWWNSDDAGEKFNFPVIPQATVFLFFCTHPCNVEGEADSAIESRAPYTVSNTDSFYMNIFQPFQMVIIAQNHPLFYRVSDSDLFWMNAWEGYSQGP